MKYQVVETYTDCTGLHEIYKSKKYDTYFEAMKEENYLMKMCPRDEWLSTHWDIIEIKE